VFNFVYADDAPDKQKDTLKFFAEIRQGKYEPYTSEYVILELTVAPEPKRSQMLHLVEEHSVAILSASDDARRLANIYIAEGVIPAKYDDDALHVAATAAGDLDFIVSFNFRHIVKRKTVVMTGAINLREGFRQIGIFSPTEVIETEEDAHV
jgi:hypothetical protein